VLHILTGCTAVGKTEWALRWAEERGAEIVSCDSLLFYRGMDIGTAKPSRGELARVRHHLVDIRPVTEPMNVAVFAALARDAVEDIASRGRRVLVVGGSGFYLKSFLSPTADGHSVPDGVRSRVAALLVSGGLPALVAELEALNPGGLGSLDRSNPRRVANALERCLASGRTFAQLSADFLRAARPFPGWEVRICRLDRPQRDIEPRIDARVGEMLRNGLVDEVRGLLGAGLLANPSAARAIGYRETVDALQGRLPMEELAGAISRDTRALVKKQRTWFRTQLPVHPVVAAGSVRDVADLGLG
jgi:tRNA dimethylallyltransferase